MIAIVKSIKIFVKNLQKIPQNFVEKDCQNT
jgi:hypothetical protein